MPSYDYKCKECGNIFEEFSSIADHEIPCTKPCPTCGVVAVDRYFGTAPPIVSGVQGITHKLPADFRYIHNRVKKANRGSTLPDI